MAQPSRYVETQQIAMSPHWDGMSGLPPAKDL